MTAFKASIKELVRKHPLNSFFIGSFAFTWLLILPVIITGDEQTYGLIGLLGLFGPALAHVLISKWASDEVTPQKRKRTITFLVIWAVATTAFSLNVWYNSGIESTVVVVIFGLVSLLPAYIWASAYSKYDFVRKSLSSLVKRTGSWKYYLFAFLMAPVIKLIGMPVSDWLGLEALSTPDDFAGSVQLITFIAISFFWGIFFAGGLNEEVGWSGFALPRLQKRFNPFLASIILWFFWIAWHIPMQIGGFWNADTDSFIRAIIGSFFARFILTWLYNKTAGGILVVMILHVSANVSFEILPATYPSMIMEAMLAIYLLLRFKMFEKLSKDDPAFYLREKGPSCDSTDH